jgi:NAD dependent epimerase/dehydratase
MTMDLRGKRVVVTGADGFIGSHLVEALLREGCDVKAFVYYNSFGSWGWLDALPRESRDALEVFAGDVRDPHGVRAALAGADVVFHLAALIGIPFSYHSPDSYVDTNIRGTLNVLQAARDLDTERVVVTSTSEVYGTARRVPIDEEHPLQGQSPYSATKIGADKLAESFHLAFGTPVITARPFNTYGPRQSARAVIPTIIAQLLAGPGPVSLGSLFPTRDLTYVEDTCAGFLALAACDEAMGRAVNIGSGAEISVGDLATLIADVAGVPLKLAMAGERVRPTGSEVERLLADTTLIRELTGWEPRHSLRDGLALTVEWFRDPVNVAGYKHAVYNV